MASATTEFFFECAFKRLKFRYLEYLFESEEGRGDAFLRALRLLAVAVLAFIAIAPFLGRESFGVFTSTDTIDHLGGETGLWPVEPASIEAPINDN